MCENRRMKDTKADLKQFFEEGGEFKYYGDRNYIEYLLSTYQDENDKVEDYLEKFFFTQHEEYEKYRDALITNNLYYGEDKLDILAMAKTIKEYRTKFEKETCCDFPNITFKGSTEFGSYLDLNPEFPSTEISLPSEAVKDLEYFSFTLGHELGHKYLIDKNISPKIKDKKVHISKIFLFQMIIIIQSSLIILFNHKEVISDGFPAFLLYLVYFGLLYLLGYAIKAQYTWKERSHSYLIEYFCDDFSMWINNHKDFNMNLFKKVRFKHLSRTQHPAPMYRLKRKRKIEKISDIQWEQNYDRYNNFM